MVNEKVVDNICSPAKEGLQFCTPSLTVSVKLGEQVMINLSFKNITDSKIILTQKDFENDYKVTIVDPSGNNLLSFMEDKVKKVNEGKMKREELLKSLPVNNIPRTILIEPHQELNTHIRFSQFYDFKGKGKYVVKLTRKITKNNGKDFAELPLDPIEVEIK